MEPAFSRAAEAAPWIWQMPKKGDTKKPRSSLTMVDLVDVGKADMPA
jgi:hypothetical protein